MALTCLDFFCRGLDIFMPLAMLDGLGVFDEWVIPTWVSITGCMIYI